MPTETIEKLESMPSEAEYLQTMAELDQLLEKQLLNSDEMPTFAGLSICQEWSLLQVKKLHAETLYLMTGEITAEDRDTWMPKYDFAKRYLANELFTNAKTALSSLTDDDEAANAIAGFLNYFTVTDDEIAVAEQALVENETLDEWCTKVVAKYSACFELTMFAEGFKRNTEKTVEGADSINEIQQIMSNAAAAKIQAEAAFTAKLAGSA